MPSPFPGMDPYLEGYLWPDVHSALAARIRQQLVPQLRPRYIARLGIYLIEDTASENDIGIMYPVVEVMLIEAMRPVSPTLPPPLAPPSTAITPASISVPVVLPVEVQVTNVEIRDSASNQVITSIEILSPINKREPGLTPYRLKRRRLYQAGVHLIELDLLRRGTRPVAHPRIPATPYLVALTHAHAGKTDVWPITLQTALPTIPVPLRPPDEAAVLDLSSALHAVYDEAAYDLSLDYTQDPPPPGTDRRRSAVDTGTDPALAWRVSYARGIGALMMRLNPCATDRAELLRRVLPDR